MIAAIFAGPATYVFFHSSKLSNGLKAAILCDVSFSFFLDVGTSSVTKAQKGWHTIPPPVYDRLIARALQEKKGE